MLNVVTIYKVNHSVYWTGDYYDAQILFSIFYEPPSNLATLPKCNIVFSSKAHLILSIYLVLICSSAFLQHTFLLLDNVAG